MNKPPITTNLLGRRATYDKTREVAHIDADVSRVGLSGSVVALRENQRSLLVMIQFDDGHAQELPVENLKFEDPDQSFHHTVANLLQRAVGHAEVLLDGTELPTEVEGGLANWLKDVRALTGTTGAQPEHAVDWGRCALEAAELGRSIDVLENLSNFRKLVELASRATTPAKQAIANPDASASLDTAELPKPWVRTNPHRAINGAGMSVSCVDSELLMVQRGEALCAPLGVVLAVMPDDPAARLQNAIQHYKLRVRWGTSHSECGNEAVEVCQVSKDDGTPVEAPVLQDAVRLWLQKNT